MTTAFVTWCGVLTLVCLILVSRVIVEFIEHHHTHRVHRIVEMSNEHKMLFVPSDNAVRNDSDIS